MKIITVTLNPAFDVHCSAEHFEACHENLAVVTEREAGGKGVNISRALAMNNVKNLALLAVGSENGDEFCRELDKDGMEYETIVVEGRIRENITIHTNAAPETRLSFTGFDTDSALLTAFEEKLIPILADGDVVTFTPPSYCRCVINAEYDKAIRRSLIDAYNKEYGMIDFDHEIVPYWQNIADRLRVTTNETPSGTNPIVTTYSPYVLAMLYDQRACGVLTQLDDVTTDRNGKYRYTNYHFQLNWMLYILKSANTVIFTLGSAS